MTAQVLTPLHSSPICLCDQPYPLDNGAGGSDCIVCGKSLSEKSVRAALVGLASQSEDFHCASVAQAELEAKR